jgi:uncharacterized protein YceK
MPKISKQLALYLLTSVLAVGCMSVDQRIIDLRGLGEADRFYPGVKYLWSDSWWEECHRSQGSSAEAAAGGTDAEAGCGCLDPLLYGASLVVFTPAELVFDTLFLVWDVPMWLLSE